MTVITKIKWVDYVVFGLSLFLIFCLVFDSYIELPRLIAWVGRWHPLVLHFPIVLLLIAPGFLLASLVLRKEGFVISAFLSSLGGFAGAFASSNLVHPHAETLPAAAHATGTRLRGRAGPGRG